MITLIESTSSSLTVSWTEIPGAIRYCLQYRKAVCSGDEDTFETLSENLTSTQARKRNLDGEIGFLFRVGAITSETDTAVKAWTTHSDIFLLLSQDQETHRMEAPTVARASFNQAVDVTWSGELDSSIEKAAVRYELQMRENIGGSVWKTIAPSLGGKEVRKKKLVSKHGYQFRVRKNQKKDSESPSSEYAFSLLSNTVVAMGLSEGMKRMFVSLENGTLLTSSNKPIPLADALGGKEFVLLYASAHWCGPCRKFTPQLVNWYRSILNKSVEVVFLSADHDENGFRSYFKDMPWLAVDFDDSAREALMGAIRISGIPRLVVFDGRTGRIVEDNAVGKPLDVNHWRKLAASKH